MKVSYIDARGAAEETTSAETAAVVNVNDAPVWKSGLSGTPMEYFTLSADTGDITDDDGMGAVTLTWTRDGAPFSPGTSYTLTAADIGTVIAVEAKYTDAHGQAETLQRSYTITENSNALLLSTDKDVTSHSGGLTVVAAGAISPWSNSVLMA